MFLTPLLADGSTAPLLFRSLSRATVFAYGTFGGGTLELQASPDGGTTWITIPGTTFTNNGIGNFQINLDCLVRATLSGSTAPNLNVKWGGVVIA